MQKWLYLGKVAVFGKKVDIFGQSGCIRVKVVVLAKFVVLG